MTSLSKQRLRVWLKLLKVTRNAESELREMLRLEYGTTLPRFDVMAALNRFPEGLKMSELSSVLRVSNGNVTGIVERLVDEALVQREQVPGDRRAFRVHLTARGFEVFAEQAGEHEVWIDRMFATLGPEDAQRMMVLLDAVAANMDHKESANA